jgi:hypothetical protein
MGPKVVARDESTYLDPAIPELEPLTAGSLNG